jgi:hypothetical protein
MIKDMEKRIKKLDAMDLDLLKWAALVIAIMLIKLIPQILNIGWLFMFIVLIALVVKPIYDIWS